MSDFNWRIDQLASCVNKALNAGNYDGQQSGRIREAPDKRTIRYYTTLGILDRPTEMRGRTAFYGRRHLLQLVCIKRLQARGMALVDVQRSLSGADDKALAKWAALSENFFESLQKDSLADEHSASSAVLNSVPETESRPSRSRFWEDSPETKASATITARTPTPHQKNVRSAAIVSLTDDAMLLLPDISPGDVTDEQLAALQPAINQFVLALRDAKLLSAQSQFLGPFEVNSANSTEQGE